MPTEDLWGELPAADTTTQPGQILKEQASLLSSKTNNVIEGVVRGVGTGEATKLAFDFFIKCPALSNYEVHLLRIMHDLLHIFPLNYSDLANGKGGNVTSEAGFRQVLKDCFGSEKVRNIISALLRETKGTPPTTPS